MTLNVDTKKNTRHKLAKILSFKGYNAMGCNILQESKATLPRSKSRVRIPFPAPNSNNKEGQAKWRDPLFCPTS